MLWPQHSAWHIVGSLLNDTLKGRACWSFLFSLGAGSRLLLGLNPVFVQTPGPKPGYAGEGPPLLQASPGPGGAQGSLSAYSSSGLNAGPRGWALPALKAHLLCPGSHLPLELCCLQTLLGQAPSPLPQHPCLLSFSLFLFLFPPLPSSLPLVADPAGAGLAGAP